MTALNSSSTTVIYLEADKVNFLSFSNNVLSQYSKNIIFSAILQNNDVS